MLVENATKSLAEYAETFGTYLTEVVGDPNATDEGRERHRERVLAARMQAESDLIATEYELGHPPLPVEHSREILEALHSAVFTTVTIELAGVTGP